MSTGQGVGYSLFGNSITSNDVTAINNYANALKNGAGVGQAWTDTMKGTSVAAKQYVLDARKAGKSTAELTQGLNNMTLGAKASTMAMKALGVAKNVALNVGAMLLISGVMKVIGKISEEIDDFIHRAEIAREKSTELTRSWSDENSSISSSISKYKELKESLDSGTLSTQEIANAKNELAEIQDTLTSKYGQEALGIDLVNGKYDEQIKKLDELSRKKAEDYTAENYANIQEDIKYVNNSVKVDEELGSGAVFNPDTYNKYLKKYLDEYDALTTRVTDRNGIVGSSGLNIVGEGTREEIYNQLTSLFNDLSRDFGEDNPDVNKLKTALSGIISDSFDTEKMEQAKSNIKQYAEAQILSQNNTRQLYEDAINAVDNYNKALASGQGVEEAKANLDEVKQKVADNTSGISGAGQVFEDVWGGISEGAKTTFENVNKMTVSLSNLKDASDSIATLQKAFDEMSEDGYITTETLSKIKEAVGDNIDNWDKYQQKLLTAKKGSAEFKQILSDLTYAIIENKFETVGLENATEEEVAAILRENGVLNASEVAHDMVTRAKIEAGLEAIAFAQANGQATDSLYEEMKGLGLTESALQSLVTAYINAQNSMTEAAKESVRSRLLLTEAEFSSISSAAEAEALALSKDNSYIDGDPAATRAYLNALNQAKAYGAAQEKVKELLDKVVGETQTKYSSSKSSSDKDKPDKADPTDAIINRIASNVEALERQGEIIDNQLDMVDAEKEYDKYVELTNKALDNRLKTIEANRTAQNELSKEAQKIRDKYKGVDVDSFFDADGDFTETYNKYYESFGSKAKQEAFANDMKMIQAFKKAWFEYYDDIMGLEKEVFDLRKELQEAHYDHLSDLINQLERHADLREKQAEDDKEHYDYLIDKEQALLDMKKAQFGIENKLLSARREAEKALATSKIGSEYLDEETRKLVYNDDDYKLEIDKINEISDYVNDLTEDYISDLNQLGEDEMYKAEEITAQYERRIAIKEKELEIVQAEIDLQKKQDTLNNVLAEKNIRQIVDGKWVWTHDTDKLRQATEDLADAKAQVEQLEREKEQLKYTNSLEARIGQWQLEQEAIDKAMEDLHEKIEEFSTKVELLKDPLENFADIVNKLNAELGGFNIDYESGAIIQASPDSTVNAGRPGSIDPNANVGSVVQQMMNNSTMWHVSDPATREKLHQKNKELGASIGADYNPADGKYYQNGKPLYDSGGVLEGLGGIKATKEDEIVLPPNITKKILDPKKNILFERFTDSLGMLFNPDLMPIQQIPFNIPQPNLKLLDTVSNRNTSVNYNMNGDVHITESEDASRLLNDLINKIKSMPIPD